MIGLVDADMRDGVALRLYSTREAPRYSEPGKPGSRLQETTEITVVFALSDEAAPPKAPAAVARRALSAPTSEALAPLPLNPEAEKE